jgi:hypothetical protein
MSYKIELYKILAKDLDLYTKNRISSENVITTETKILFHKVPYPIISNGNAHNELLKSLFSGKYIILEFCAGSLQSWYEAEKRS